MNTLFLNPSGASERTDCSNLQYVMKIPLPTYDCPFFQQLFSHTVRKGNNLNLTMMLFSRQISPKHTRLSLILRYEFHCQHCWSCFSAVL